MSENEEMSWMTVKMWNQYQKNDKQNSKDQNRRKDQEDVDMNDTQSPEVDSEKSKTTQLCEYTPDKRWNLKRRQLEKSSVERSSHVKGKTEMKEKILEMLLSENIVMKWSS